jgi:pimeloyl-ACP methyl ester carboxylesterase
MTPTLLSSFHLLPFPMNPSIPNQYDPANAAFLACFAAAAYQPHIELADFQTTVIASRATDTRALIACDGEDCCVAFRGTQDLRNWLTDLDCTFVRVGKLRIHRGFYEAMESVREELRAELEALHYKRLWLTGHSLGGALAMLGARIWDGAVEGVYTFGQPRVPWLLGAYRHAGHEIHFPFPPAEAMQLDSGSATVSVASSRRLADWPSIQKPLHVLLKAFDSLILRRDAEGGGRGRPRSPLQLRAYGSATGPGWVQDRGLLSKLPWDLFNAISELRRGQLALLDDHHISRYLALFPNYPTEACLPHS